MSRITLTKTDPVSPDRLLWLLTMSGPTYLAAPYTDRGGITERSFLRYYLTQRVFAKLIEAGICVFSPLDHTHPVSLIVKDRHQVGWLLMDKPFLDACNSLVIVGLDGWEESAGIAQEMEWFSIKGKDAIFLLDPYKADVRWIRDYNHYVGVLNVG